LDLDVLRNEIVINQVTILWLTSALFHLIVEKFLVVLKPIRILLAGGDVLNVRYVRKALLMLPELVLINGYGPTENTTFSCCHRMTIDNIPERSVPIGIPITGTKIHILDEERNSVGDAKKGELYVSGLGVALGYIESSSKEEAFFLDPKIAKGLIYRTGDFVLQTVGGELEFLGRSDSQVKVRGFRIDLEEVRLCFLELEFVSDVLLTTVECEEAGVIVVAFVQFEEHKALTVGDIRVLLLKSLPKYMIPERIVVNPNLPINRSGKLDRAYVLEKYL